MMDRAEFRAWLLKHEPNEPVGFIRNVLSCPLALWSRSSVGIGDGGWTTRFIKLMDDLVAPVQTDGSMPVTSAQAIAILDSIK